jgi:hypothetical protein
MTFNLRNVFLNAGIRVQENWKQKFIINNSYQKIVIFINNFSFFRPDTPLAGTSSNLMDLDRPRLTAVGIRCADHATPSICKSWHKLCRQAAVARSV